LFHVIKRVAIQEELQTFKMLTEVLAKNEVPCALVREDGRVFFRNPAFQTEVPVEPGNILPKDMRDLVEQQIALLNLDHKPETSTPPLAFYQASGAMFRLDITQLHPSGNEEAEDAWLVRLNPADDPYTLLNRKLQRVNLTPREVEVTILAGDGLEDLDIAQRLFIAPQTVKNHLKSIYKKLDVHSRTQLAARLRPSLEEKEG
jgi:DNA-binding CsgD family transcriptional regulator